MGPGCLGEHEEPLSLSPYAGAPIHDTRAVAIAAARPEG